MIACESACTTSVGYLFNREGVPRKLPNSVFHLHKYIRETFAALYTRTYTPNNATYATSFFHKKEALTDTVLITLYIRCSKAESFQYQSYRHKFHVQFRQEDSKSIIDILAISHCKCVGGRVCACKWCSRQLTWFPNGGCRLTMSSNSLALVSKIFSKVVSPALTRVVLRVSPDKEIYTYT